MRNDFGGEPDWEGFAIVCEECAMKWLHQDPELVERAREVLR